MLSLIPRCYITRSVMGALARLVRSLKKRRHSSKKPRSPTNPTSPWTKFGTDPPEGKTWEPPSYVGVFKEGEIVGYHCCNEEIEFLEKEIDRLSHKD